MTPDYSTNPGLFRDKVILPALLAIESYSAAAERLVLCTALAESGLRAVKQFGGGPALGYFQMEPATHQDIFTHYLGNTKRQHLVAGLYKLSDRVGYADELAKNPQYAAAMCRIHYLRVPKPLPNPCDLEEIAHYWKGFYNSSKGAGTIAGFLERARPAMAVDLAYQA